MIATLKDCSDDFSAIKWTRYFLMLLPLLLECQYDFMFSLLLWHANAHYCSARTLLVLLRFFFFFSKINHIFEGLNMLENSQNFAHASELAKMYI